MNAIVLKLKDLVAQERKINAEVIRHLILVSEKRLHLEMGYASLFSFCTEFLGYSEAAASRRVQAVKLASQIQDIPEKLEKGILTFSAISQAQSFFRQEDIQNVEAKKEILINLENQSLTETKNYLNKLSNQPKPQTLEISEELFQELKALQVQLGKASLQDVLQTLVKEKTKKLSTPTPQRRSSASYSRYVPKSTKQALFKTPRCQYTDPKTGRRCDSSYKLQVDHIYPYAKGGATIPQNLRLLCQNHNLFMAEQVYGENKIQRYIK